MPRLAGILLLAAGCTSRIGKPVPEVEPPPRAAMLMGGPARAMGADQEVPREPEIAWSAEVGRGLFAPVVVTGPLVLSGAANHVVALVSTESGRPYWKRTLDGPVTGGVAWRGDRIYVGNEEESGRAYALRLSKGRQLWEERIGSSRFAPLLLDDLAVYATDGGAVVALDAESGEERWTTRVSGAARAAPLAAGELLVLPTASDTLYALDRRTGQIRGRRALPAGVSASPALRGDTLYLPFHTGLVAAYALPEMTELWRREVGAPVVAVPIAAPDGWLYVLNTHAEVWRLAAGGQGERLASLGGAASGSLALARDHLLVGRLDGTLFLLRRNDGGVVWEKKLDGSIAAPATAHEGAVYVPLLEGTLVKLES